ncbi:MULTISPECIES: TOPRIM nucleotidyl transferase/hydrolase domain-containing protein [unclassified Streptomyces]|uniref:TOPRIM nucleotidyl transferase/hydrolase domain-containing protein n=1 Tax=unclassified Streptomyces TaxID=2593676 RepID=UPI00403C6DC4
MTVRRTHPSGCRGAADSSLRPSYWSSASVTEHRIRRRPLSRPAHSRNVQQVRGRVRPQTLNAKLSNPPSSSNITLIDVNGHDFFGRYVEFLNTFSIPWAVIADGPALQPGSGLHKQLKERGHLSEFEPSNTRPDFEERKKCWAENGVFSMADAFGTDGSHAGELEAYFMRLGAGLFREVNTGRSKPRVAAAFASRRPIPKEVADLYTLVQKRLVL